MLLSERRKSNMNRTLTLPELKERLKSLDEVMLLELLDIASEDLVETFSDTIENNYNRLLKEVDWEETE
jgi:hypothetical protein